MTQEPEIFTTARAQFREKALFEQAKTHAFDYMDRIRTPDHPVFPGKEALAGLERFKEPLPGEPGDAKEILNLLHTFGSPGTVAQTGGRYFGFVNGAAFPVALAAKWLADVWDQNAAMHVSSPVAAKLEAVCEAWLKELFNLPESTRAGFVSGTSTATFAGLAAARNHILERMGWDADRQGLFLAPRPRVILGEQAHSTVFKALSLLGFGSDALEIVPCDSQGRLRADLLPGLDKTCIIIAQAGNVSTGAFDPLEDICARANRAWVHVDGAFGLWAAASPAHAPLVRGMERADSWSADAHKTLNTPYDCGIVLCRRPETLASALRNSGDYIVYSEERDPMRYTPEMSRRARGVELWATMKFLGRKGIGQLVAQLCRRAQQLGKQLQKEGFVIHNEVVFNQVLVSCRDHRDNPALLEALQAGGTCWCGGSTWQGNPAIRVSVCAFSTTPEDIDKSVAAFVRARKAVQSRG